MREFLRILGVSLFVAAVIGPALVALPICLMAGPLGFFIFLYAYPVGVIMGAPCSVALGTLYAVVYFCACRYFSRTTVLDQSLTRPLGGVIGVVLGIIISIGLTFFSVGNTDPNIIWWFLAVPAGICGILIPVWLQNDKPATQI